MIVVVVLVVVIIVVVAAAATMGLSLLYSFRCLIIWRGARLWSV